jgi:hypothetical protein
MPKMLELPVLERALQVLGDVLDGRRLSYQLLAVGGSSLLLLGIGIRPTADVDIVGILDDGVYMKADPLPTSLTEAVVDVSRSLELPLNWVNAGPASIMDFGLPPGFEARITVRHYGGLELHLIGREDQVCLKLYAAVDQGPNSKHFADLQSLTPTRDELIAAARWTITHDPSEGFRQELDRALTVLDVEVRDGEL